MAVPLSLTAQRMLGSFGSAMWPVAASQANATQSTRRTAAVIRTRVQLPTSRRRNPCAPSMRFPFLDPGAWTVGGILGGSDFEVNLHRPLLQATIQPKSAPEHPLTVR